MLLRYIAASGSGICAMGWFYSIGVYPCRLLCHTHTRLQLLRPDLPRRQRVYICAICVTAAATDMLVSTELQDVWAYTDRPLQALPAYEWPFVQYYHEHSHPTTNGVATT